MTQNYGRVLSIVASPGYIDPQLRFRFEIQQHTVQAPNRLTLKITNQLPATAQALVNLEFTSISLSAGYEDNNGLLFSGNIVQALYGRENQTDTLTTIFANDGDHGHNFATVSKTLPAGSTPQDHVNAAMAAMAPYGIALGYIDPALNLLTPVFPRAVALFGMARDVLANVAKSKQATVSYQNGQMQMIGPNGSVPGGPVVINSNTGMIGMPTQDIGGVMVRVLINAAIKVNTLVHIDQSSITNAELPIGPVGELAPRPIDLPWIAADGIYRVFQIGITGDTRGNPWYMDLSCLVPGQSTAQSRLTNPTPAAAPAP